MSLTKSTSPQAPATDLKNTALILAWPGNKGGDRGKLISLIKERFGLGVVCPWSASGQDKDLYPVLPKNITRIIILPIFMCRGFTLRTILPGLIENFQENTTSRINCLQPISQHTELADMVAKRATICADKNGISSRDAHLILVAHGSEKHPESAQSAQQMAQYIRSRNIFTSVNESYLEQVPTPETIITDLQGPVIAEGLFLTPGRHFSEDFPAALTRSKRSVLIPAEGGLSTDPMFNNMVCDVLERVIRA
ncbi:MAG: hypothetical protein HON65_04415 [Rhodospirillales bacterium]|jgi:sirohydrochlorin ferrochelatase|nr:hypothetical protein [Rhodospirillales bacterium]